MSASALVIGAGHNGLVAAVHLARAGVDVTVLEQAPRPGGATASGEVTLPDFVHDHCAAFGPLAAASPALRELRPDLRRAGLRWIVPDVAVAHPFEDGTSMVLHRDLEATVASLGDAGPAWRALMERMLPVVDPIVRTALSPIPPVRPAARVACELGRDALELGRLCAGSVQAFGHEVFGGRSRPTAWLAGSAMHAALPPDATTSAGFGLVLQLLGHAVSWPLARGGMQSLPDALVKLVEEAGGTVRCAARAERVLVRSGRTVGVRLASGEDVAGDLVLATVTARPLAALLPDEALPHRLVARLRAWRYATCAFKLDYALSGPVPWTAAGPRASAVVHVGGELAEIARALHETSRGEVPLRPALVVGQQSLFDAARAPAGQHTLYVYGHVPTRPDLPDDEIAERIEAQLDRFAPGWRDLVLARSARGPQRTEAENPSLVGGDLMGGAVDVDQQLIFRPAPELCRYRTPLRGLYVAGASVHPGGAVHGMSGRAAARAMLRDRRLERVLRRRRGGGREEGGGRRRG